MTTETEQPPQVYKYSVRLETTQKCVNVAVHVYSDDIIHVVNLAIDILKRARAHLEAEGFIAAPLEVKEK